MFKFYKKNKTKINIGLFITVVGGIILQLIFNIKVLSWISNKIMYIFKISVPIWAILVFIILFLILKKEYKNYSSEKIPHLDLRNYKADKMFGVIFEFNPNAYRLESINIYCPKCLYPLEYLGQREPMICRNCEFVSKKTNREMKKEIGNKIDHKIKTGEYEKVVGKKPKDFLESEEKFS